LDCKELPPRPEEPAPLRIAQATVPEDAPLDVEVHATPPFPEGIGAILGTIIGLDDKPVAGVEIVLHPDSNKVVPRLTPQPMPKKSTWTDGSGAFRFSDLSLGEDSLGLSYSLLAFVPGEASAGAFARMSVDFPKQQVWLEFEPVGIIAGRVVSADGAPLLGHTFSHISETGIESAAGTLKL
jgi:hypothetical protein